MKKHYRYRVTGIGQFPIDMLRYDCAWPSTSEDAGRISELVCVGQGGPGDSETRARRTKYRLDGVVISSDKAPTPERWESFLWHVEILP
jgi:hypothetical protein